MVDERGWEYGCSSNVTAVIISLWGYTYGRNYLYSWTTVSVVIVLQPNALNSSFWRSRFKISVWIQAVLSPRGLSQSRLFIVMVAGDDSFLPHLFHYLVFILSSWSVRAIEILVKEAVDENNVILHDRVKVSLCDDICSSWGYWHEIRGRVNWKP